MFLSESLFIDYNLFVDSISKMSQLGDLGSGAGKGGGGGGSIRAAGGAFGRMEAAHEEEFFYKKVFNLKLFLFVQVFTILSIYVH